MSITPEPLICMKKKNKKQITNKDKTASTQYVIQILLYFIPWSYNAAFKKKTKT